MAQRLAEAVGREYIRKSIERRASFSQESLRYLMEEEERLKGNLQRAKPRSPNTRRKPPMLCNWEAVPPPPAAQTGAGQQLAAAAVWSKINSKN